MSGLFVTGTDTGCGKTVVSAAIVAALRAQGRGPTVLKPVITGLDDLPSGPWSHDHEVLAGAAGATPEEVAMMGYGPAVSPHLAAELAGRSLDTDRLVRDVLSRGGRGGPLIVEGAGGLLVPIREDYDMRALAADLGLPVVIAARPGLGTINHTLLTVEAARRAGLELAGIVLTPWPRFPGVVERSNRETITRLSGLGVSVLRTIPRPDPRLLARAGAELPLDRWLGDHPATAAPPISDRVAG